jgi:hypothetical protein
MTKWSRRFTQINVDYRPDIDAEVIVPPMPADNTKMDLNENHLWVSLVFGAIGAGMFLYGKKAGRMVPLGAGLGLMVVPYFIPNVILMAVASCAITALPWFVRES